MEKATKDWMGVVYCSFRSMTAHQSNKTQPNKKINFVLQNSTTITTSICLKGLPNLYSAQTKRSPTDYMCLQRTPNTAWILNPKYVGNLERSVSFVYLLLLNETILPEARGLSSVFLWRPTCLFWRFLLSLPQSCREKGNLWARKCFNKQGMECEVRWERMMRMKVKVVERELITVKVKVQGTDFKQGMECEVW